MTEETVVEEQTIEEETPKEDPAQARILELLEKQDKRLDKLEEGLKPKKETRMPPARRGRQASPVQAAQEKLEATEQAYREQAMELERLRLARKHDLDPKELEGDFGSAKDMRQYAQTLADRRELEAIKAEVKGLLEPAPAVQGQDTGGPTAGGKGPTDELDEAYERVKGKPFGLERAAAYLEVAHQDPRRDRVRTKPKE